jgi:hypothetical protein
MQKTNEFATEKTSQFSKSLLGWVADNSVSLQMRFAKKFPTARNKFNLDVRNASGSKRVLILSNDGSVKVDAQPAGRKVLAWATLRKIGCPAE